MFTVAALSSERRGLRTTNGDDMVIRQLSTVWLGLYVAVLLPGCAASMQQSLTAATTEHTAQMLRNRETELAAARADIASARIAQAKQEAELQELRSTVQHLRQENSESHQALLHARQDVEANHAETANAQSERAQQEEAVRAEQVQTLRNTVAALKNEIDHLKQGLEQVATQAHAGRAEWHRQKSPKYEEESPVEVPRAVPSILRQPMTPSVTGTSVIQKIDDGDNRITVQPGDTLWSLARRHRTTVSKLRQTNQLKSEVVNVGSILKIPASP